MHTTATASAGKVAAFIRSFCNPNLQKLLTAYFPYKLTLDADPTVASLADEEALPSSREE